jgi:hypothetical protein
MQSSNWSGSSFWLAVSLVTVILREYWSTGRSMLMRVGKTI